MIVLTFGQALLGILFGGICGVIACRLLDRLMAHARRRLSTLSRRIWKK